MVYLKWRVLNNQLAGSFEIQRSVDGINFSPIGSISNQSKQATSSYTFEDDISSLKSIKVYYRIQLTGNDKLIKFSNTINLPSSQIRNKVVILPNPVKDIMQIQVTTVSAAKIKIDIVDGTGKIITSLATQAQRGNNIISVNDLSTRPQGIYFAIVHIGDELYRQKVLLVK